MSPNGEKKSNPKILMFREKQENYCHTTKHFTLQQPQRVIYYLDDKEKTGHEKGKILKCFETLSIFG